MHAHNQDCLLLGQIYHGGGGAYGYGLGHNSAIMTSTLDSARPHWRIQKAIDALCLLEGW